MTEILAGGTPPYGQDVNGILYMLSAHIAAIQAGQYPPYNATLAVAMGGYAVGASVSMADGTGIWVNNVATNATNPDTGGAGWVPLYSYGYATLSGLTGGTVTVAQSDARRNVLVLSGTLVGNLQVVVPNWLRSWLIVNNTSGAFTTTVRTSGGAGVPIPQGGFGAPTEVYGDGTNIYNTVAPLVIPGDVNPTPNTFAIRSNNGYLFATYFNQNSSLESFTMSEIFAGAGDGYLRKISPANFAAQIALSQFAGAVVNAQVPQSAVTQYAAAILASAALTGTPTAPTPSAGDNSTRVATTAFVAGSFTGSLTNGSMTFPGGLIVKWGFTQGAAGPGDVVVSFATPFPNNAWVAVCNTANRTSFGSGGSGFVRSLSLFGFTMLVDQQQAGAGTGNRGGYWIAIGN
jgi:hypothetical protein